MTECGHVSVWRFSRQRGESRIALEAFCKRHTALGAEVVTRQTATSDMMGSGKVQNVKGR